MKTTEEYFRDWESETFGFGYGTGEEHTLAALKTFMANIGNEPDRPNGYDYQKLESSLTPTVAWLLINILCRANVIEYGTSPRGGWLTASGKALKQFVDSRSIEQLVTICCDHGEDYFHCYLDHCNCDGGYWPVSTPSGLI